ncbi:MAG: class I SAM-dependent methyltransferase [Candidatus Binatus sp.]|uniref:class I SAM-dependent methyltransferase n=1 Tax=Candidatus Binatus sp. TaxID=2811406 RepID=UPI003C75B3CD
MDFDAFLERCRAQWPEFADARRLARSTHPADRSLSHILGEIPGMATENKLRLLNCAVASLDEGEVYVEVGCYKGASLVGAAASNPRPRIFACDNFSQFDGAADALRRTLDAHTAPGQVTFHDIDFRDFLAAAPWRPAKIGAYFYDGGHSFADQYDGVALAIPHLADDALVIVDDTNKRAARSANNLVAHVLTNFDLILDLRTSRNHSPTWWNGVQVYRYQRRPEDSAIEFPTPGFSIRKLVYDDIFLEMKHRRRARRKARKDRQPTTT